MGPPATPPAAEEPQRDGGKRTYAQMLAEDIRLRVAIPSDARASGGVPLGRLTAKTRDPFFAVGGVGVPSRGSAGIVDGDSEDSGWG